VRVSRNEIVNDTSIQTSEEKGVVRGEGDQHFLQGGFVGYLAHKGGNSRFYSRRSAANQIGNQ